MTESKPDDRVSICAVSYLNSVPLVWGLLHDPKLDSKYEISFRVPSGTAEMVKSGAADIGIVSSIELPRQSLDFVDSLGVASFNAVRSIFLIATKPISEIRSLAADASSRTSTVLCRILLERHFRVTPEVVNMPPDLPKMLNRADAALIIGDPALHLDPRTLPYVVYDLGEEWTKMTGLPMVYAVWAARNGKITESIRKVLVESYQYGRDHIEQIVATESRQRGFTQSLTREYLTHYINYEIGPQHLKGLDLYLQYARDLDLI